MRIGLVLLTLFLLAIPVAAEEAPTTMPSEACVRALRTARVAGLEGDRDREVQLLQEAVTAFPGELAPIQELLARRDALAGEEFRDLLEVFRGRLREWRGPLPLGMLEQMVSLAETDTAALQTLGRALSARIGDVSQQEDLDLLLLRARISARLGEKLERLALLERAWILEPGAELGWSLVSLYQDLDRWEGAARLLGTLVAEGSSELRWAQLRSLAKAGLYEELDREMEALFGLGPEERPSDMALLDLLQEVAWDLRDSGRDEEAEAFFRRAQELDPRSEPLQRILLHLYSTEEERQAHSLSVAQHWNQEGDPRALFDEGTHRLTAGDAESAFELLARAAPGLPDLEPAWYNLGLAAYRLEKWSEAAEAYGRSATLNPDRGDSHFFRGLALQQLERCGDAVVSLERALELDASRTQAYYYLAYCYRALGESEKASAAMEQYRKP